MNVARMISSPVFLLKIKRLEEFQLDNLKDQLSYGASVSAFSLTGDLEISILHNHYEQFSTTFKLKNKTPY